MIISKKDSSRRRVFTVLGALVLVVVILLLLWGGQLMPVDRNGGREIQVVIPPAASTSAIALILEDAGVIKNADVFRLYARIQKVDNQLQPGRYLIHTTMPLAEIVRLLAQGPAKVSLTIPEGYTVQQIGVQLEKAGITSSTDWHLVLEKPPQFRLSLELPLDEAGVEGYLYPDTYLLEASTPAAEAAQVMLEQFCQVMLQHDYLRLAKERGLSLHQAVTIASMVEREAKVAGERPRIAGVIFNRLALGMPLQIDATVQYALGETREKLYYRDLEFDSPYNTYLFSGLPPGPIASPGWPSLEAAVLPEEHDYLYYVAKLDGSHAFASTFAQHLENIDRYQ